MNKTGTSPRVMINVLNSQIWSMSIIVIYVYVYTYAYKIGRCIMVSINFGLKTIVLCRGKGESEEV